MPADAEYVIEGYLGSEGYIESEGPFGEFLGYYGGVKTNPVFHVTAITHRRDALFQTLSISGKTLSRTDTAQLTTLRTESLVWRALENAIREPVAVYAPPATGGVYNVRMRDPAAQSRRGAQRDLGGLRVHGERQERLRRGSRHRHVLRRADGMGVGDAAAPRPRRLRRDGLPRFAARPDARRRRSKVGSKAGFDLTLPFGGSTSIELSLPEAAERSSVRASRRCATRWLDGPKYFEQLMAALGTADGRESS